MFPQTDRRTLETGSMINPATGVLTDYEECWIDVEPVATRKDEGKKLYVLALHDDENKARGMVVRVGQFCQGVLRVGDFFSLERWVWNELKGWQRKVHMGDLWIPCGLALDETHLQLGGEITYGDYQWKVLEMS
jgi:hypothetical protein